MLEKKKESEVSEQEDFLPTIPAVTELTTNQPTTNQPFFPTRAEQPIKFNKRLTTGETVTEPTSLPLVSITTQSPSESFITVITREPISESTQKPSFSIPQIPTRVFTRPIPEVPRSRDQSPRKLDTVSNIRNIIQQTNEQSASLLGDDNLITPNTFRGRSRSQSRLPVSRQQDQQGLRSDILTGQDLTLKSTPSNIHKRPPPRVPIPTTAPATRKPVNIQRLPVVEENFSPEYEYEYYYEYLDDRHDKPNSEYDLVPLANKVRILDNGEPHCLDVGVFPHPFSCKMFVNCYRNPGAGVQGSIYQCPSYLAFDPVGGRCNWVNEIVCSTPSR